MEPIEWEKKSVPGSTSDIRGAKAPEGTWYLRDPNHDVCYGKLTLARDANQSLSDVMAQIDARRAAGAEEWDDENRRLWATVSPQEDMCFTHDMAQMIGLVERLRDPRPPRGSVIDILTAAGGRSTRGCHYSIDIGKGSISVDVEHGVSVTYDPANSNWWHNLMAVYTSSIFASGQTEVMFWPDAFGDVAAKGAEYLVDVLIPQVRATRITRDMKKGR